MNDAAQSVKVHELKCWPMYYEDLRTSKKLFDLRKDDRGFNVGDKVFLREYDAYKLTYTGRTHAQTITYILRDFDGLVPGYVVLGLTRSGTWLDRPPPEG